MCTDCKDAAIVTDVPWSVCGSVGRYHELCKNG